jgi:formylglycine-generating enzyme required for sulfatase activity
VEGENSPAARALALDPPPGEPPFPGMVWIPGGDFTMGSDEFYPEGRPSAERRSQGSGSTAPP